jgi:hypothetical protein
MCACQLTHGFRGSCHVIISNQLNKSSPNGVSILLNELSPLWLTYGFRGSLHVCSQPCVEGCPPLLEVGSSELGAAQQQQQQRRHGKFSLEAKVTVTTSSSSSELGAG